MHIKFCYALLRLNNAIGRRSVNAILHRVIMNRAISVGSSKNAMYLAVLSLSSLFTFIFISFL